MRKKVIKSAKTGKFVSKEFEKENPETTVVMKVHDERKELKAFFDYLLKEEIHPDFCIPEDVIDDYLSQK